MMTTMNMRRFLLLLGLLFLHVFPAVAHVPPPISQTDSDEAMLSQHTPSLLIPSANIRSQITTFELGSGSWVIDPWEPQVGHLQGTAALNQRGNVVLAGHSEHPNGNPGVFSRLMNVELGDLVIMRTTTRLRFYEVVDIRTVDYRDLTVVYPSSDSILTLITCDVPSYDASRNWYDERLVVIAQERWADN